MYYKRPHTAKYMRNDRRTYVAYGQTDRETDADRS